MTMGYEDNGLDCPLLKIGSLTTGDVDTKFQIEPEEAFTVRESQKLLSLLEDQSLEAQIELSELVKDARNVLPRLISEGHDSESEGSSGSGKVYVITFPIRYIYEFEELGFLGLGGSAHVMKCRHILDGKEYAVKKIRVNKPKIPTRTLREIQALSAMNNHNIVGYHHSWLENGFVNYLGSYEDATFKKEVARFNVSVDDASLMYIC